MAPHDEVSLEQYFNDLQHLPVMDAKEALAAAKLLAEREIATWRTILALRKPRTRVREAVREVLPDVPRLSAPGIRWADVDRKALAAVLPLIHSRRVDDCVLAANRAREAFVSGNLRLAVGVANFYKRRGAPLGSADLIQEGNIGLLKAVGRYDHRRGYKFSTYATWWIRAGITRALAETGHLIRVPVATGDALRRLRKARDRSDGDVTTEDLAKVTRLAPKRVEKLSEVTVTRPLSLSEEVAEGCQLGETIPDPEDGPLEHLLSKETGSLLREALAQLDPTEARVLRQRFGLDCEEMTLREIGERRHLSRERIRQIEVKALGKLRKLLGRDL